MFLWWSVSESLLIPTSNPTSFEFLVRTVVVEGDRRQKSSPKHTATYRHTTPIKQGTTLKRVKTNQLSRTAIELEGAQQTKEQGRQYLDNKMSIDRNCNEIKRRYYGGKTNAKCGRWSQAEKLTFLVGLKKL
jgi:hypothetical protein